MKAWQVRLFVVVFVSVGLAACSRETALPVTDAGLEPYNDILLEASIAERVDDDVAVREILFAPGWAASRHFHNSDLFIYVVEGDFEVALEDSAPIVYAAGQAMRMPSSIPMTARNASDSRPLKLAVFQVGQPHAPFSVLVDDPR